MAKVALLVGVSNYEPGLPPLPSAIKDVATLQQVLQHPEIGSFDQVRVLEDPERHVMEEAIDQLFSDRDRDDLVLFFFSGHGIVDEMGRLFLAARNTSKTPRGALTRTTAVSANTVHDLMDNSASRRRVVILDCCFSGAFAKDMKAKDDGSVDILTQLGGEGRAILTSSNSIQYSFEDEQAQLSVYTRYLVEGLKGAADQNNDGFVSVGELHKYTSTMVRQNHSAMKPESYISLDGFDILLSKVPVNRKQEYRKAIKPEYIDRRGEVIASVRWKLDECRDYLGLSEAEAIEIETEVLEQYRKKFKAKLQRYERALNHFTQGRYPLSDDQQQELQHLLRELGLRNRDADSINIQINKKIETYQQKLQQYERAWVEATQRKQPPHRGFYNHLKQLAQSLNVDQQDTNKIDSLVTNQIKTYQENLQQYEQKLKKEIAQQYPLSQDQLVHLQQYQQQLGLLAEDIVQSKRRLFEKQEQHQQKRLQYEQMVNRMLQRFGTLSHSQVRSKLRNFQRRLNLDDVSADQIEEEVTSRWEPVSPPSQFSLPTISIPIAVPPVAFRRSPPALPGFALLKAAIARASTFLESHQQTLQKLAGASVLVASAVGGLSFWNQHTEQTDRATLAQIVTLNSGHQYDQCIGQAQALPASFRFFKDAQENLNACRFNKAKNFAEKSKFQDAIALAVQVPAEINLYGSLAQNAIETWSNNLIQQATKQYQAGKKDEAIAELKVIPVNSAAGKKAQETTNQWNKEWTNNVATLAKANRALTDKKWTLASDTAKKATTAYWKQKAQPIIKRAEDELASINAAPAPSPFAVINLDSANSSNPLSSGEPPSVSSDSSNKTPAVRVEPPPADFSTVGGDQ